ncbi:succinylglutamate desuccinylase [Massilia sp. Dwa41.01b]|uniref:succinylglutamate desuccinylase n=1 Tax=unclassified Massilia TaxID=2609279 RepID=UPI0016035205|nr:MULTISPECIES: succinylglutamate desuccinylase [unclassified Massilia]QNA87540.1 succinylglutamate desuccinylase [Massilia sp. Dwa41.01b]QNA98450.1 succinylglutamate desuccinylase [Massilia sp. Se16.2.3]
MSAPSTPVVADAVRALAEADFGQVAQRFTDAGFVVGLPARGILTVKGVQPATRPAVLLSVGVHGDETGPIEMVAHVIEALSREPQALAVDLMLCVGNIDAIAAGKRFLDADLNRMFKPDRGALAGSAESARADELIAATDAFFAGAGPVRWHLDLHTAIRASHYPMFAIVPDLIAEGAKRALIDWLGQAAIGALVMNPKSAGTYSYYSAEHHGAAGSTVELGRVGTLGQNNMAQFADSSAALDGLLRGVPVEAKTQPHVFKVAQEIVKLSDGFKMGFSRETPNFASLKRGEVIATDGDTVYTVFHEEELVVFPNPDVRVGLRAGLMVVRVE